MKKKLFFAGMAALLLTFGLVVASCGGGDDGGTPFDGATLAGTKWVAIQSNVPYPFGAGLSMDMKATLEFTSDTAGTATVDVTKWNGDWDADTKEKAQGMMAQDEDNGAFTSTYDAATKTGTYTLKSGTTGTFTVNVEKKELTTTEVDEDGETETIIYKLQ
ncbi:MAG: hypothetical protein LBL45_11715 [Treponema sp.]|jgi:hypothetical protein|nr:hypothetical protein [Treponema sp.]